MERSGFVIGVAFGFAVGAGAATALLYLRKLDKKELESRRDSLSEDFKSPNRTQTTEDYVPPLPDEVKAVLSATKLCHLSCRDDETGAPHTSLMNFTFVAEEEDRLVMATRRDTRKFKLMLQHTHVTLLLHDFPQSGDVATSAGEGPFKRTLSVSLYGSLRIEKGAEAERYRRIHLWHNDAYRHFIEGDDKAIVTVKIARARMCNLRDQVTEWSAH